MCVCASNPDVFARALEMKAKANKRPRRVGGKKTFYKCLASMGNSFLF